MNKEELKKELKQHQEWLRHAETGLDAFSNNKIKVIGYTSIKETALKQIAIINKQLEELLG